MVSGTFTKRCRYDTQWREPGEHLEVPDDDAAVLIGAGYFSPNDDPDKEEGQEADKDREPSGAQPLASLPNIPKKQPRKVGNFSED